MVIGIRGGNQPGPGDILYRYLGHDMGVNTAQKIVQISRDFETV